jgi:phosphoglycolate phosphatase-like HAD superfamily hydrolase
MTTSKASGAIAIPRVFILDCDGVLTDPVVKCVTRVDVFAALGERLDRGEVVTINTGRSLAWLLRNGIIDFIERSVHDKANLERFMAVCEKGASWITFIGGVIRTNIDKTITVPDAVREDVYDLVEERFRDCMFWDPTKLTMISVEMIDGMPVEAFHKRQAEFVVEAQAILDSPEHAPFALAIDASNISTDIQDHRAGKHLGARRIVEWLERRGLAPEHFVTVGDSQSDTAMAEELQDAHSVDFVFVGDPARLNAEALRCRVVQTAARFELGTLEYLESLP